MEAIVNNLIKAIGWSIFHSLWQGAIIYGILVLTVAMMPGLNAKIKHNMAYSAMCLMFAGFCITFFSIFSLPREQLVVNTAAQFTPGQQMQNYLLGLPAELNNRTEQVFPYLVSVYGIGLLFQLLILSMGYKKLLNLKQAERTPVPSEWQELFRQLCIKLNLRKTVSFHLSSNVNIPLVIGYFKPVVLFPIALVSQLDIKQVEAILIHELSHIRRNDYVLNLIKTAIETILFFNPFVWLTGRFINIEREHACDDLVIRLTGTPVTYAHALLKLEILKDKTAPAFSMAATGRNQHLYQRIKRITDMKTNYMNVKQQLFAVTLTVATVISLAWVNPGKATNPQAKQANSQKKIIKIQDVNFQSPDMAALEAKIAGSAKLQDDTTKKKKKFKIVTVDAKGEKKEYSSVEEMPDSLRQEVINDTFLNNMDFKFDFHIDSITNHAMAFIKSPEFRKSMDAVTHHTNIIIKKMNSPEWKKQQADIQKNAAQMARKFNSEDFKKMQKEIEKSSAEVRKQAEEIRLKVESPEFKKQIREMKEFQESKEYKELKEKFDKDIQQLKEKKGIKSDLKGLNVLPGEDRLAILSQLKGME